MNRRRGASLAELLVVMTACSVVMTLTSQLVCRVMRIQIESRAQVDVERNAMRLSDQFRSDVHRAKSAVTDDGDLAESVVLRLEFADGRLAEYSWDHGTAVRQVSGGEGPAARDEFEFPATADLAIQKTGTPPRLVLTLSTTPPAKPIGSDKPLAQPPTIPASLQAVAVIGRDTPSVTTRPIEEAPE